MKNNFMTPQKHNFKASLDRFFSSASVLERSELHTDCVLNNGDLISFSTSTGHTKKCRKANNPKQGNCCVEHFENHEHLFRARRTKQKRPAKLSQSNTNMSEARPSW